MRTYKIINVKVKHPSKGNMIKKNIVYFHNDKEFFREFYNGNPSDIRDGYKPKDKKQPLKPSKLLSFFENISKNDINEIKKILTIK